MRRGEPLAEGVTTVQLELDKDAAGRVLVDIDATVSDDRCSGTDRVCARSRGRRR
jgi:hypothetical protein